MIFHSSSWRNLGAHRKRSTNNRNQLQPSASRQDFRKFLWVARRVGVAFIAARNSASTFASRQQKQEHEWQQNPIDTPYSNRYMVSGFVFYYALELTCSAVMFILVRLAVHYDSTKTRYFLGGGSVVMVTVKWSVWGNFIDWRITLKL